VCKFSRYSKINIYDIGCGNGLPSTSIIDYLIEHDVEITYTALDISDRMIQIDKKILMQKYPELTYRSEIIDLDNCNLSKILLKNKSDNDINLLLFLGGTVGNQKDTSRILSNLRDSMSPTDFLLIGAGLETNEYKQSSTEPHNEYHYKRTTWILDYLGLKDCYPDSALDTYDQDNREYIRKIPIQKDASTTVRIEDKEIKLSFKEGDEILVSRFRRFTEEEIVHDVLSHNFAIDQFISGSDNSYVLLIIRPKTPM
jgi:uncharacterized SAM-dependent methyltransferase